MTPDLTHSQIPLPMGVVAFKPAPRAISSETVEILQELLAEALAGHVTGLALVVLHSDGRFGLRLRGDATTEPNQMGVVGMLASLQKMALELH